MPPSLAHNSSIWNYDKFGHFSLFATWTILYGLAFSLISKKKFSWWTPIIAGIIFGVLIEVLQNYLPYNRSFEWMDIVADALGALAAGLVLRFIIRKKKD